MTARTPSKAEAEAGSLRQAIGEGAETSKWKQVGRLLTDWQFASRVVRKRFGLPVPMDTEDRRVLEQIIFPFYLASRDVKCVLFVGCDWYTRHYQRFYFPNVDYWTIEPATERRKFGAKQHIVAPLEELSAHFPVEMFDLIVCNGVYGWGLNSRDQCESAFAQCYTRLRSGGHLLLGWDDIPERNPVPIAEVASLQKFSKQTVPALGFWRYLTDTPYRHTYDFYRR
jgi:SAM-dependent methyltransferase